ncbi:PLP-dependent aminotransferase family protein [Algicella marina]|uniref:Aminotransferase class I/II-fold pyridoxal phosphate-dependent enzyme n=1 Tax=Algicella marina TaxID=2683284 RepID=A0A6P1SYG4_9RHOB|nr:PLP-dependent aminotransferase family protein [Algicella marina]QHQ34403.1 aminotransferase class I/II-fold pyridoxal phosphate-dependent enzyme [Algicella marina]
MTNWLPDKSELKRPRYRSLMEAIEHAIENGLLLPGDRLPTHRELAFQLQLSVQTVSRAYTRLIEAGHIVGEVGRGSFVRNPADDHALPFPAQRASDEIVDLALLKPIVGNFHRDAMQRALRQIAGDLPTDILSSFRAATIAGRHVEAVDEWLELCGVPPDDMTVIATNGSTAAMTVAMMSVARSGDLIVTEKMSHHTVPALCRSLGLRLHGLAIDEEGILPSALDAACRADSVKALYVVPDSGPVSCTMGTDRRQAIVELARQYDIAIIENDACGPLPTGGISPLSALAPERSYYFTSLTKCLLPGLRVGFLAVPHNAASTVRERHMITNWMVTPLMHEIATRWIEDGTARALLDCQRDALRERAAIAEKFLGGSNARIGNAGLQVWLPCPDIGSEARLVERSREAGILVAPGSTFSIGPLASEPGVRVSLGISDTQVLRQALRVLRSITGENALMYGPHL